MRVILAIIIILIASPAFSDTHTADSCSVADVTTAYNAAEDGDTISVPAGSCDWSGGGITLAKAVAVIGATTGCPAACVDNTVLAVGTATAFTIGKSNVTTKARISGFTFTGTANAYGAVQVYKTGDGTAITNWRIDGNNFSGLTSRSVVVGRFNGPTDSIQQPAVPGVIDANLFTGTANKKAIQIYGGSRTSSSWNDTLTLGGTDFVFVENNKFTFTSWTTGTSVVDHDCGGRSVIRHNDFEYSWISYHGQEANADGNQDPATHWPYRSSHGWENYKNAYVGDGGDFRINIRGGTGVVWGNVFTGTQPSATIAYLYDRGDRATYCLETGSCQGSNELDENQADKYGYLCYQQIGTTGADGITAMPAYQWLNSANGVTNEATFSSISYAAECNYQHVQFARDIILNGSTPKDGYTAAACPHTLTGLAGSCTSEAGTTGYNVATSHTVTSSKVGTGGTLSFEGEYVVTDGADSPTYTQTPNNGYRGTWSGTCGATGTGTTYQKTNVTADCTVVVTFDTVKIGGVK